MVNDNKYSDPDYNEILNLNGLYIGILGEEELDLLKRCQEKGYAKQDYSGINGLLGLGKVKVKYYDRN